jgi:hypothetical protein
VASVGIGVCGVSASIAAAGAIGAPAIYPTMVSAAILIFAAVELIVLPWVAISLVKAGVMSPEAAGAWMGLSVKTDGAAAASAEIVARGVGVDAPLSVGVMSKVLIDIWIGVIAFVLALIWVFVVEVRRGVASGRRPSPMELWYRFPKFVLGYFFTSLVVSALILQLAGAESRRRGNKSRGSHNRQQRHRPVQSTAIRPHLCGDRYQHQIQFIEAIQGLEPLHSIWYCVAHNHSTRLRNIHKLLPS